MPFEVKETEINYQPGKYTFNGKTECVALVQQLANMPSTEQWRKGLKVKTAAPSAIKRGAVIATFNANGRYPKKGEGGRHAAIYLSHDAKGIKVIDQWADKSTPSERLVRYLGENQKKDWQNNGDYYYVVEVEG